MNAENPNEDLITLARVLRDARDRQARAADAVRQAEDRLYVQDRLAEASEKDLAEALEQWAAAAGIAPGKATIALGDRAFRLVPEGDGRPGSIAVDRIALAPGRP